MTTIKIKEVFSEDYISREAGAKLRGLILAAHASGDKIQLDFSSLIIASSSFFDEGIAKLAEEGWQKTQLDEQITFVSLDPRDKTLLDRLCKIRGF